MPMIQANGQRLYVEDVGEGAPALVFSHGLLMDHEMYAPQVSAFRGRRRCVTWDQRGHGGSVDDGAPFTYWDSAQDCLAMMDVLGIDRAVLVGLSQGGFLSMRAALLAPERIVGLVLIATQSGLDPDEVNEGYVALGAEWSVNGPANAGSAVAKLLIGEPQEEARWLAKWSRARKDRLAPCIDTLVTREDLTDRLGEIRQPALVIHGEADTAIAPERGAALAQDLPDARGYVTVAGAAHVPNLTHPDVVNPAIAAFLDELGL